jgi:hypothetical protein
MHDELHVALLSESALHVGMQRPGLSRQHH